MGKSHKITTFKSIGKSIGKSSINGPSFSCDYEDARISPAQLLALAFFGIQGQRALAHVAASAEVHSWDIHVRYPVLYHFQKKANSLFFRRLCRASEALHSSPHSLFLSNIHSHPRAHLTWNTTDMFDSDPKIKNDGSCRSFPWSLSKPMGYLRISIIFYRYPVDGFNPYACVWTSPKNAWLGMLI